MTEEPENEEKKTVKGEVTEDQGGPTETSGNGASTSQPTSERTFNGDSNSKGSRAFADLRQMTGAMMSTPSDGYVVIGMLVPETIVVLE